MIVGGMRRHALWIISLVAIVHGAFYVAYLKPEWDTAWSDREGYVRLGEALAESGRFTRYPDAPVFVPEVIRTPGYPAFVAVFYRLFGVGNDVAVAAAQVAIYPLLCLLVYAITRRIASERAAVAAAAMTALFSPIAHFAGLILTEFWTTVVLTAALYVCLRALQQQRLASSSLRARCSARPRWCGRRSCCSRSSWRSACRCSCARSGPRRRSAAGWRWRSSPG